MCGNAAEYADAGKRNKRWLDLCEREVVECELDGHTLQLEKTFK